LVLAVLFLQLVIPEEAEAIPYSVLLHLLVVVVVVITML
jgi:hypothetical protein